MNVILDIPVDLQVHIEAQIRAGIYSSAVEYFLGLGQQDRQRQDDRAKIKGLLQEGLDSDSESITPEYWQHLRASIFDGERDRE